ncbi:FMN-binding protein [Oceanirhabdus sp. W0125-5]|uniref:FMN-binding protein n=1 Tax=Oceanirhabdus sp. W0125-5 TaxID=2999116 RepID=UPI0022F32E9C|nr:FMN-binding protein [Oceanirhabdus sp. W0125-5]WBW97117.1 FMN-binding protein [Oceanirhabdus sp. W0125-5]
MIRNRILAVGMSLCLVAGLFVGCGSKENNTAKNNKATTEASSKEAKYADGIYFAQEENFAEKSGWKYVVTLEVKDGKIVSADWNGAHKNGGADKKTQSKAGNYKMANAQAEWHEQAEKVEAYLIEKQDPSDIKIAEDGKTDAISGASITVKPFFELAKKALNNGVVGKGEFKDGTYHAEAADFADNGWKETVDITVINGNIVAANWNAVHKDGGDDKKAQSVSGAYGMVEKAKAQAEWHEQAAKAEAYLIEKQDPTDIKIEDDGKTDAITGVSIHVSSFFKLAEEALADAK